MKTYIAYLIFLLINTLCFGQDQDVEFHVTKKYDEKGNLISYDSVRTSKHQSFKFSFNHNFHRGDEIDSLLSHRKGFDEDLYFFFDDSLKFGHNKAFNFWVDDLNVFHDFFDKKNHDSLLLERLQKTQERIEKRIKNLKEKQEIKTL
ncbi:MAG: hypothetical protein ACPHUE_03275 [Flavobacteriaceae bacterium]